MAELNNKFTAVYFLCLFTKLFSMKIDKEKDRLQFSPNKQCAQND